MSTTWLQSAFGSAQAFSARGTHLHGPSNAASITLALDSAYVYGTSGDAVMWGFIAPNAAPLQLEVYIPSYTGTWASTDGVINVEVREGLNGTGIPGTTLVDSFTITLNGSAGWFSGTGTVNLVPGRYYTIVVADADGGGTNFATIQVGFGSSPSFSIGSLTPTAGARTTSNGYSTAGTGATPGMCFAAKIGDTHIGGSGFSSISTTPTGTYRRGVQFTPHEDAVVTGWRSNFDQTLLFDAGHTVQLWHSSESFTGTPLLNRANVATARGGGNAPMPDYMLFEPSDFVLCEAGETYHFVIITGSSLTVPRKATLVGTPSTLVKTAMLGNCAWVDDRASPGTPAVDDTALAVMSPILVPPTAVAGGGDGNPWLVGGGLVR